MNTKKIALIVVGIVALGGVGYYFYKKSKGNNATKNVVPDATKNVEKTSASSFLKKAIAQGKLADIKAYRDQLPLTSADKNNYE